MIDNPEHFGKVLCRLRGAQGLTVRELASLARMSVEAARHASTVMASLPAVDHIRPIFDLAHRVDASIPAADDRFPEVAAFRELLSGSREIGA